eukprot:6205872-Pleurochrysis_carterae.AAC.1
MILAAAAAAARVVRRHALLKIGEAAQLPRDLRTQCSQFGQTAAFNEERRDTQKAEWEMHAKVAHESSEA